MEPGGVSSSKGVENEVDSTVDAGLEPARTRA